MSYSFITSLGIKIFDIYDFVTNEEEEEDKMMRESGEKNTVNELRFGTVCELREI